MACSQTVIVVIVTCSCNCSLLSNGYCGLPMLLGPAPAIVACSQTVIVACPCNILDIVTCSCNCSLLSNGYCDLPVLLGPVHDIVACSQMVIVACPCNLPCYCDLFMLLWLALEPVIVYALTPIYQFLWNYSKYVILHILAQWWLVPPENAVLIYQADFVWCSL